jgi:hypothetical protein
MDYDDRALRGLLNRIAHALEAIARATDPKFKTLAETARVDQPADVERATGTDKGPQSPQGPSSNSTRDPWIDPSDRKGFLDKN